jgi:hypothetical protein
VIESLREGQTPHYAPYFLVESVLGIPKKVLVKAYIIANNEFFRVLSGYNRDIKFGKSLGLLF